MIAKCYYENVSILEKLRELSAPAEADLEKVLEIITDDDELSLYFYDVLAPEWVELLDKAGEFEELREKETGMIGKYKAHYLKGCAEAKAEAVLGIIEKIEAQDINIQGTLTRAIVKMPEETAIKGIGVMTKYLDEHENKWWYTTGESAAELMIKLMTNHSDEAFEVAEALLGAWVSEEKTFGKDIVAKFSTDEYSTLMLEHYSKVWEAEPERAVRVLIKILNRCLETLDKDGKGEEGYDASKSFGYRLAMGDLDNIDMQHPEIKTLLVKGICEAGRVLIDKEPGKVSDLLDLLEVKGTNKVIFLRIAMYLLRFVKPGTEKKRISKFVGNKEYYKEYRPCWYEHRRLLNDKFDEVKDKKAFLEWVDEDKYDEEMRKNITEDFKNENKSEPDFEKWENFTKAEQLYLVRERFKVEYEGYKEAAGVKNDSELAPRKSVSEARFVDPREGSPLTAEDMAGKTCDEVLDYLLEPKHYEGKERASGWGTKKDALAATFKNDVKKRYKDYLECDVEKRRKLSASFLARFFYGEEDAVREGSFNKKEWELLIGFASLVVEEKHKDQEYRDCFSEILSVLREGFGGGKGKLELDESTAKEFWGILKKLIYFPVEKIDDEYERDPVQLTLRHVAGKALGLTVLLGATCKKEHSEYWEKELKAEIRECWKYTLENIREPGINCVFGIEFSRIHWLDTEWAEENLDLIFRDELWDEIWGTYVSWGRPSPKCFDLLVLKGQYLQAVKKIESKNKFKFGKEPDKGLVEHLIIGYFNGWIGYEHEVLQKFFEKAPAELRAKAARFMTTGFKGTKEGDDEKYRQEVAARMKRYWESRLARMDKEEAMGFMKWVSASLLGGKETLEFLKRTLDISGGELAKHENIKAFVEGVCKFGKEGNELLALQCFKKAAADKNIHMTWSRVQEPLESFLEAMVAKPDVRSVAIDVADAYGRYNPDKFRGVWAKLNEKN